MGKENLSVSPSHLRSDFGTITQPEFILLWYGSSQFRPSDGGVKKSTYWWKRRPSSGPLRVWGRSNPSSPIDPNQSLLWSIPTLWFRFSNQNLLKQTSIGSKSTMKDLLQRLPLRASGTMGLILRLWDPNQCLPRSIPSLWFRFSTQNLLKQTPIRSKSTWLFPLWAMKPTQINSIFLCLKCQSRPGTWQARKKVVLEYRRFWRY